MKLNSKLTSLCLSLMMVGLFAIPAMAQPTISKTFSPNTNTVGPGSVSTITITITNGSATPVTDLAFTDVLPVVPGPMTIADPAMATTTCIDGVVSAPSGGSTITLSDGKIGAFQSCFVTVNVTAGTPGVHTNPAITLSSSAGSSMSLPVDLTVVTTLPGFSKSFAPSTVDLGETSTLTFTIDNSWNASRIGSLDFTDIFPIGLEVADPSNASTDCISAGFPNTELTAIPGSSQVILDADGSTLFPSFEVLPAGATCTVTVDVVTTGVGQLDNLSGELLADFTQAGKSTDQLEVTRAPLHIRKNFVDDPVLPGSSATLEFRIDNFNRDFPATGVAFTDDLTTLVPPLVGLTFGSLLSNDCGGSVSGVGGTTISLTGGTIPTQGFCTMKVSLDIPAGALPGAYTNTTSAVTGTVDGNPIVGNSASADLFVASAPTFTKEFLEVGTLNPNPVVSPGDDVVLRFTIGNTDPTNMLTDLTFTDELTFPGMGLPFPLQVALPPVPDPPCGAGSSLGFFFPDTDRQGLELTGGNIAGGGSCTFEVTITIPPSQAASILTNTTSELTGTLDGTTVIGAPATDDLVVLSAPELSKSFSTDIVQPGGQVDVTFTLSLAAEANVGLTNISFSDDLSQASFAGASAVIANPNNLTDNCSASISATPGSNMISVSGVDLMPGESCSITLTLDIPAGATLGTYTNSTSAVTGTFNGQIVTGVAAEDDLLVTNVFFTKEFIYTNEPALPGDVVTMRLILDNTLGTADAQALFIDDNFGFLPGATVNLPPVVNDCGATVTFASNNLNIDNFTATAGNTCTVDVEVVVPANAPTGSYLNSTSNPFVLVGGNPVQLPPASDDLDVNADILGFTKEFTNDPVLPGDPVDLKFSIENLSAVHTVTDITFTDDLGTLLPGVTLIGLPINVCGGTLSENPAGVLELTGASLAPGAMCMFTVTLIVPTTLNANNYENITNELTGKVGAVDVFGGTATDVLRVRTLSLEKAFAPGAANASDTKTLTFTLTNLDVSNAITAINFLDDLDAFIPGATVATLPVDVSDCGGSASVNGAGTGTFSFMQGSLAPGGSCSFDISVQIPCNADGNYTNTTSIVSASGFGGSINAPEASASLNVTAAGPATFDVPGDVTIYMDAGCNYDASPMITGEPTNIMHECCTMGFTSNHSDDLSMLNGCGNTGVIKRTWTVTDCNGVESPGQVQMITVTDNTPPTFTSCPPTVTRECSDDLSVFGIGLFPTITDNCDITPDLSTSDATTQTMNGSCSDHQYTITRTWVAKDNCDNENNNCVQIINVVDTQGPTPACNNFSVSLSATGDASITMAEVHNIAGSTDNCSATVTPVSISKDAFTCDDIGPNSVTLTAEDACGNTGTCVATVTIVDDTPPTVTCQPATYTLDASGNQIILPADLFASGMDNCGTVNPQSANPPNLTCDNIGTNNVILTVNDGNGNTATCMTTVTILAGPYFTWYKDTDNDGYSSGDIIEACTAPWNYKLASSLTTTSGDCNDNDPFVHPDRFELCNGIDDDCDGTVDEVAVTGISIANISICSDNGTSDPADDTFTADVTVTFDDIAPLGSLYISGDGSAMVNVGSLGGNSHTFIGVSMSADGTDISLSAGFSITGCVFTNANTGLAPASCSPCEITGINVDNMGNCDPNGNIDPSDDTFTGDVTVTFFNAPATGTLDLTGDGAASVDVAALIGNSHTFTGVQLPADGGAIALTATFSDEGACSLTVPNAGLALAPCCFVEITGVDAQAESCLGFADGTIEIFAVGTGTLNYSVDGGATYQLTNNFTNLSPGVYSIVVEVQGQSCTATTTATVNDGPAPTLWYKDADNDGYTDGTTAMACTAPTNYVAMALLGDCNDNDANEFPGQDWYEDADGDGYGNGTSLIACARPLNYFTAAELTATSGDCDDSDPAVNPGATEVCNGIDDDCDGMVDNGVGGGLTFVGNVVFSNQQQVDDFSQCYSIIDGNLTIQNSGVNDLSNLIYLEEVTGYVDIKTTSLANMSGLDALATVGGYLRIRSNSTALTSLNGLEGVTSVGGNLNIYYNNILTDCCAVFELMESGGVGGSITIFRNDTGCDNYGQVEDDCDGNFAPGPPSTGGVVSGGITSAALGIQVFPNPNSGKFEVRLENSIGSGQLALMDASGRMIWETETLDGVNQYEPELEDHLAPGLYLILFSSGHEVVYEKVVVE